MKTNLDALKKRILSICLRKVTKPTSPSFESLLLVREGMFLGTHGAEDFDEAVRTLCADDSLRDAFSKLDLEEVVADLICKVDKVPEKDKAAKIDAELGSLEQRLTSQLQLHFLIAPLDNFEAENGALRVGNVSFHRFSSSELEEWLSDFSALVRAHRGLTDGDKVKNIEFYRGLLSRFVDRFVAGVDAVATENSAWDLAIRSVRSAISVLKLYSLYVDWVEPRGFGLLGEIIPRTPRITLRRAVSKRSFGLSFDEASSLRPYKLDKEHLEFMRKNGFSKLDDLLRRTEKTNLDRRLLRSISWFAEAFDVPREKIESKEYRQGKDVGSLPRDVESPHVADRFLKLILSLESLFTFGRESNKTSLAEMCAFLLSGDFQKRLEIKRYVLRVYGTRSKVVHEGDLAICRTEADRLMGFVRDVILKFVLRRDELGLKTVGDLKSWYEKCKLDKSLNWV
nr:HEPN domain-containing protein [Candidatus Njordarchaeota archaeon]